MGLPLGDELENKKALVYYESFFAAGATGLVTMFSGEPSLLFGLIPVVITVQSSVNFSSHVFLNKSHFLKRKIYTMLLISFILYRITLRWMPIDQKVSRTNPNDPLSV